MCGIAAIVGEGRRSASDAAIARMTASLAHRGPDEQGVVTLDGCRLGHRRLCVIDPVGGGQPMSDPTGRFHLTFNGEIYNYRELRSELESHGVRFRTNSDTEVLLAAFGHWGDEAVTRFNGQFAFAVWDARDRTLFAARDRLGEKPLYWAESPGGELLVASEIRGLVASGLIDPRLDRASVDAYLKLIYVPPERSIYENVHPLRPGHCLRWCDGRVRTWSYWEPRLSTEPLDEVEAVRQTRTLIERAVERQMVADTPVGAFLSGGLDSSTIVALMTRTASGPVQTFAAGFGDLIDELPFARAVAEAYGTEHRELQVDIPLAEMLERMAEVYDEPLGDSSNIPTYLIAQFARQHVKVVLSGDGGDELFGGYEWYRPLLDHDRLPASASRQVLWHAAAKTTGVLAKLGAPLGAFAAHATREYKGIREKRHSPDVWTRHLDKLTVQAPTWRDELWGTPPSDRAESLLDRQYRPAGLSGVDPAVDFDLRCYLPGDIFVKVDRAAMAHGLETRSPFMDVELVEFVLSLPWRVRFGGERSKRLLREACGDLWPAAIRARSKQGFGAPLGAWLQRPEMQTLADRVFRPRGPLAELLPGLPSQRVVLRRRPQACWNLLCLGLWLEKRSPCASLRLAS